MPILRSEALPVSTEGEVVLARQAVRRWAAELKFGLVDQTKLVTAASELARNALVHGGGGTVTIEVVEEMGRTGLRLTFADAGKGIQDVEVALQDGYTTGAGLGMGLGGSRRLVHDFAIDSSPNQGTRVTICRWK